MHFGMGKILYWSGATGNTHRFVEKIGLPALRIQNHGDPQSRSAAFSICRKTGTTSLA